jgi:hypothetical protein
LNRRKGKIVIERDTAISSEWGWQMTHTIEAINEPQFFLPIGKYTLTSQSDRLGTRVIEFDLQPNYITRPVQSFGNGKRDRDGVFGEVLYIRVTKDDGIFCLSSYRIACVGCHRCYCWNVAYPKKRKRRGEPPVKDPLEGLSDLSTFLRNVFKIK